VERASNFKEILKLSINLNHFRGETTLACLTGVITNWLKSGMSFTQLSDLLGVNEWWLVKMYDWFKDSGFSKDSKDEYRYKFHGGILQIVLSVQDYDFFEQNFKCFAKTDNARLVSDKISVIISAAIASIYNSTIEVEKIRKDVAEKFEDIGKASADSIIFSLTERKQLKNKLNQLSTSVIKIKETLILKGSQEKKYEKTRNDVYFMLDQLESSINSARYLV
jgi:hypothetical protein